MDAKLKDCPFCGASAPNTYSNVANDKMHAIQCTECPGGVTCTSSTFEQAVGAWNCRRFIAPPVAAGSVEFNLRQYANGGVELDSLAEKINAWGAQQHYAGVESGRKEYADSFLYWRERAEKAEADLASARLIWAESRQVDEHLTDRIMKAEARVKDLEAEDLAMHRKLASETLRADQGWARYEAANRAKNDLERERGSKQAIIDRLMLEYCPDEMTAEQVKEWGEHQVRAE